MLSPCSAHRIHRLRDLRDQNLVMLSRDSNIRAMVDRALDQAGYAGGKPAYEVTQITTAIMLVEAGLGATVLPAYARAFAHGRAIVTRPLIEPQLTRDIVLIHPDDRSLSPAAEGFVRVLKTHTQASVSRELKR